MKIVDGIPTWQHEDFILRCPTIEVSVDNIMFGWAIIEKDTEVSETFEMTLNVDFLKDLCISPIDPSNYILNTVINESIKWIVGYMKNDIDFKNKMLSDEFSSKLRFEIHTWFVNDNKSILNVFENMIKEYFYE